MERTTASPIEPARLADDDMKTLTGGLKAQWMDGDDGDGSGGG